MTGSPPSVDQQCNSPIKASEPVSADLPPPLPPLPPRAAPNRYDWWRRHPPLFLCSGVLRRSSRISSPAEIFFFSPPCCKKRVHRPLYIPCFASALWDDDGEDFSLACRTLTFDPFGADSHVRLRFKITSFESWLCVCEAFCWGFNPQRTLNCAPHIPACMSKPWSSSFTGWRYFHIESLHLSRLK